MADETDAFELERIHERPDVGAQLLLFVAAARGVRPAVTTQVRHDAAKVAGQFRRHPAPHPPMLWPPMEEQQRWTERIAEFRDVDADSVHVHEVMSGALELGKVHETSAYPALVPSRAPFSPRRAGSRQRGSARTLVR